MTVVVSAVTKTYPGTRRSGPTVALDGIDMHVEDGEMVCIVGASGCGKSTLLNIVGGLDTATSGEVRVDGDLVVGPGPDRGMVFQGYSLFPWKTVRRNISFGLECAGWSRGDAVERVEELLGIMSLTSVADHRPGQLSGGMRQRVAIARALAPSRTSSCSTNPSAPSTPRPGGPCTSSCCTCATAPGARCSW